MPGIFGAVGVGADMCRRLRSEWKAVWPDCETRRAPGAIVGAHAFGRRSALVERPSGSVLALDGEASLYRAEEAGEGSAEIDGLFDLGDDGLTLSGACRGNLALMNPERRELDLAVEWTGSFPLYYRRMGEGLAFSTLLRPLARATSASPDPVAMIQFLRTAYTCDGRSLFRDVQRLQPGQSLHFEVGGAARVRETSSLWSGSPRDLSSPEAAADVLLPSLRNAVGASLPEDQPATLMMSGGWDSRTLLSVAAECVPTGSLDGFSHGDTSSRELRLVREVSESVEVPCELRRIDEADLDLDFVEDGFGRVESAVFPHWLRSGATIGKQGPRTVFSGVYGEIPGGHYGETMMHQGLGKVVSLLKEMLGRPDVSRARPEEDLANVRALFQIPSLGSPWYLEKGFLDAHPDLLSRVNQAIDRDLERLEKRGISRGPALVEAFVAEHRGSQYINAQILSCRGWTDVAIPFADRDLLRRATSIPLDARIHNRVNRVVLDRVRPSLLRFPLSATLASAAAPLIVQEMSRAVRKIYEQSMWRLHHVTGGRVARPRLGWVDFEFLKESRALERLVEDLKADLWDREGMMGLLDSVRTGEWEGSVHPLYDQMGKIYTVDLMVR